MEQIIVRDFHRFRWESLCQFAPCFILEDPVTLWHSPETRQRHPVPVQDLWVSHHPQHSADRTIHGGHRSETLHTVTDPLLPGHRLTDTKHHPGKATRNPVDVDISLWGHWLREWPGIAITQAPWHQQKTERCRETVSTTGLKFNEMQMQVMIKKCYN